MKLNEASLLSHTAKLTGARFRSVISERDRIIMPRDASDFATGLEQHRQVEVRMPCQQEWTRVTSPEQLRALVDTAWTIGYQVSQSLLPPAVGATTLVSDACGQIRNLLVQCPNLHFAQDIAPVWDQLASHTAAQAHLTVAIPQGAMGDSVRDYLNQKIEHADKLEYLEVPEGEHWLSQWSRDSILPLRTAQGEEMLGVPNRTYWSSANRSPEGDTMDTAVAFLMAQEGRTQQASPLPWISLDGGNVVNNADTAFVGQDSIRNTSRLLQKHGMAEGQEAAQPMLSQVLGKEVVVLPQMTFHIDLSCTPLGEKTMLVADPTWGKRLLQAVPAAQREQLDQTMARAADLEGQSILPGYLEQEADSSQFEQAVAQLEGLGYEVLRLPYLGAPGHDRPVLSYNNVLVEEYADVKQVFLPQYGCQPLDQAARHCYEQLGYSVVRVDMAVISRKQGALRCSALPTSRA